MERKGWAKAGSCFRILSSRYVAFSFLTFVHRAPFLVPFHTIFPPFLFILAKGGREGKPECKAIQKVEWKSSTSGYIVPFVFFFFFVLFFFSRAKKCLQFQFNPGIHSSYFRAAYPKTGPVDRPASLSFTVATRPSWRWSTTSWISSHCATLPGPAVSSLAFRVGIQRDGNVI